MALGLNFGDGGVAGDGDSLLTAFTSINNMFSTTTKLGNGDLTINDVRVGRGAGNIVNNTALGNNTLTANTSGINNTAVGISALAANTIGGYNTAVGISALAANTSGTANTAIGNGSSAANQGGGSNTSLGSDSLFTNISGNNNTAIGKGALQLSTSNNNTAIGTNAGLGITTESNTTCLGYNAQATASNQVVIGDTNVTTTILRGAITADKDATFNGVRVGRGSGNTNGNTVVGNNSLTNNTTGINNTAIGISALTNNQGGSYNTAVGISALQNNTSGTSNTAIGNGSSLATQGGQFNTSLGSDSLFYNISGNNNTAIGKGALQNSTLSNNTAIGYTAGSSVTTESNSTCLGYNAQVAGSNEIQLGSGTTSCYTYGALNNRSDLRDKTEVRDTVLGLDFVNSLRAVDYKWDMREDYRTEMPIQGGLSDEDFKILMDEWLESVKLDNLTHDGTNTRTRYHHGLIAQEVQDVIEASGVDFGGFQDHSVNGGQDVLSIGYTELIAPMIKAIQELTARINVLEGN